VLAQLGVTLNVPGVVNFTTPRRARTFASGNR
jgi:hypothetical protein